MSDAESSGAGEESSSLSPAERILAAHLESEAAEAPSEDTGDPAALARLMALHEIAERGLDALAAHVPPEALDAVASGRRIGDYRLIEEIASGGMGALYLARDEVLGRLVAVKLLTRHGASTEMRFQREAEIAAALDHPHIVDVFQRGVEDGVQYIAMRYIAGPDISRAWRETSENEEGSRARRLDRLVAWVGDAARALHYAHEQGVLHRDVKPGNILVEDDHVYVVDFGLATYEGGMELTKTGDRLGTLPYMPPEQIRGDHALLDRRGDVYGLGATLYQLLSGRLPFAATNPEALARQILRRDPPDLASDGVPRDLEAVVMRALEKDPERRYATARELAEDLDRYILREPVRARRLGPLRRAFRYVVRRPVASLVTLVLVLGAAGAIVAVANARDNRLRADSARYERALADADRGEFAAAVRELDALSREGAAIPGLDETRVRNRVFQLYDDLMRLVFIPRDAPSGRLPVARTVTDARAMLDELDDLDRRGAVAPIYRDRLRFVEIVVERRTGERDRALALVDAWEEELGASSRLTVCARALAAMRDDGSAAEADAGATLESRLAALPLQDRDDHYHAALAASRLSGAEGFGLTEVELYLRERPDDYWARHTKGNLLRRLRRLREAREVYGGLIASMSGSPGRSAEARALRVSDKLAAAYWQRGLVAVRLARFEEARRDFERARPAVRDWALALAKAACDRGLGRAGEALEGYRRALADLDRSLVENASDAVARRARRTRVDVVRAVVRCMADLGQHDEARAALPQMLGSGAPEARRDAREAELLAVAVRADELRRRRDAAETDVIPGTVPPDEGLVTLAEDLEKLVVSDEPDRNLDLLRAEASWFLGRSEEALERLAPHARNADANALYYRGYWRYRRAKALRETFFDRRLPADAAPEVRATFKYFRDLERDDIRAATVDFGVLRERGFATIADTQDPSRMAYFYGCLRRWNGEPRIARAILEPLRERSSFAAPDQRALLEAELGRAARDAGEAEVAWRSFGVAIDLAPDFERAYVEMGRLAATQDWAERALEVLRRVRARDFAPNFTAKELNAAAWADLRDDPRFAEFR